MSFLNAFSEWTDSRFLLCGYLVTNIQLSEAKLCFIFTGNKFYFRIYPLKLFNGELTLFIHPISKVNKIFVSCFTRSHFHAISEFIPFKFIFLYNSCTCHIEHFFVKIFSWQILTQDGVIKNTIAHCRYIDFVMCKLCKSNTAKQIENLHPRTTDSKGKWFKYFIFIFLTFLYDRNF